MTTPTNAAADGVPELVRQRDQLRAWIAKLDEVQGGAPSRVTERVRADYQDRLRRVTEELSAHGEEIRRGLDEQREQLAAAEERRVQAADALEETRLRHLIGELDEGAWNQARQPLEAEAAAADEAVAAAQAEVDRLSTLSSEIGGGAAEPEVEEGPAAEVEAPAPRAAASAGEDEGAGAAEEESEWGTAPRAAGEVDAGTESLSGEDLAAWITEVEAEVTSSDVVAPREDDTADAWDPFANEFGSGEASPAAPSGDAAPELPWLDSLEGGAAGGGRWSTPAEGEDDLAFLEELDRAISGGTQRPAAPATPAAAGDGPSLSGTFIGGSGDGPGEPADGTEDQPKRGEALLCKECGAINEPQAWYCEICGSEL